MPSNGALTVRSWCGPCKMLDPVLQTSAKERNVRLVKVDCDENVETASQYGVRS